MKFLTPVLVLLMSLNALAQWEPPLDPARQAERDAVYGNPYAPGHLTPGNSPYHPGHGPRPLPPPPPRPPVRPLPPPAPHYGYGVLGPQYTVRWDDRGVNRVPKLVSEVQIIHVGGRLVNEVLLRAIDNRVDVESAVAYLINGQVVNLMNVTGSLRDGREVRSLLDAYYSLRVDRIEIRASTQNLIGSRGKLQVILGLAE